MLELYLELFRGNPRFAPGSTQLTLAALSALGAPAADGLIADMGCGEGSSTLVLARNTDCRIVAMDLQADYIAALRHRLEEEGFDGRVSAIEADFADPPLKPASVDLLWSEGAVYNLGFEAGLTSWRPHLRPGGGIAVSELTWLDDAHGQRATEFFAQAYPAMTTIEANLGAMRRAGFETLEPIVFPPSAWEDEFYGPLERSFPVFLDQHEHSADAAQVIAVARAEIETYRQCGDCYSYVFYLGRAT